MKRVKITETHGCIVQALRKQEQKVKDLAKYLHGERSDYAYLKSLFQYLRAELKVDIPKNSKKSALYAYGRGA